MLNEKLIPSTIVRSSELYDELEIINEKSVYSTAEKVIGKWIDGKKIYRRVITGSLVDIKSDWTTITKIDNVDEIINIYGTINNTTTDLRFLNINSYENSTYNSIFSFSKADGNVIQAKVNGWNNPSFKFKFKVCLEYTKTTD